MESAIKRGVFVYPVPWALCGTTKECRSITTLFGTTARGEAIRFVWYRTNNYYLFMPHVDKITSLLTGLHGEVNFKIHSPDNEKITKPIEWSATSCYCPWPIEMSKMWCRKRLSKMSKLVVPFPYLQLKQPAETMRQKSHNRRVRQLNPIRQILPKCRQSEL